MSIRLRLAVAAISLALFASLSSAQTPFTSGNLVIYRVGSGSAALANTATATFLDEFTTAGVPVQNIALPTTVSGSNLRVTASGTATSEGLLTRSPDGRYLTFTGYDAAVGTGGVVGTTSATVNRVVGLVGNDAVLNTSTATNTYYNSTNIRGAVTDGMTVWMSGPSNGVVTIPVGTVGAGTPVSTTITNTRAINIFNNQLYISSATGAFQGVSTVGTGTPTSSGNTITLLPGFPTAGGPSPYGFFFADANTVYVADDRTLANGGGLQKWTFNGTSWALAYTLNGGLTNGLRGLTGLADGSGSVTLYATTADAINATNGNKLVGISDVIATTSNPGSTFTTLATAPGHEAFRGVAFAPTPIPEPGTLLALSAAGLGLAGLVRRAAFRLPRPAGRG